MLVSICPTPGEKGQVTRFSGAFATTWYNAPNHHCVLAYWLCGNLLKLPITNDRTLCVHIWQTRVRLTIWITSLAQLSQDDQEDKKDLVFLASSKYSEETLDRLY